METNKETKKETNKDHTLFHHEIMLYYYEEHFLKKHESPPEGNKFTSDSQTSVCVCVFQFFCVLFISPSVQEQLDKSEHSSSLLFIQIPGGGIVLMHLN